jgi:hypothetical protein
MDAFLARYSETWSVWLGCHDDVMLRHGRLFKECLKWICPSAHAADLPPPPFVSSRPVTIPVHFFICDF